MSTVRDIRRRIRGITEDMDDLRRGGGLVRERDSRAMMRLQERLSDEYAMLDEAQTRRSRRHRPSRTRSPPPGFDSDYSDDRDDSDNDSRGKGVSEEDMSAITDALFALDLEDEEYQIRMATALSLADQGVATRGNPGESHAESSRQGASRNTQGAATAAAAAAGSSSASPSTPNPTATTSDSNSSTTECLICTETFPTASCAVLACQHAYCRDCLTDFFSRSLQDETIFPPSCCKAPIPIAQHQHLLPATAPSLHRAREAEVSSAERLYCSHPRCSAFIPASRIAGDVGTCPSPACRRRTCKLCRRPEHADACAEDVDGRALLDMGRREGWQRCGACGRMVEKTEGCVHMVCLCGYGFCYRCGGPWPSCHCADGQRAQRVPAAEAPAPLMGAREEREALAAEFHRRQHRHEYQHGQQRHGRHAVEFQPWPPVMPVPPFQDNRHHGHQHQHHRRHHHHHHQQHDQGQVQFQQGGFNWFTFPVQIPPVHPFILEHRQHAQLQPPPTSSPFVPGAPLGLGGGGIFPPAQAAGPCAHPRRLFTRGGACSTCGDAGSARRCTGCGVLVCGRCV
ncbi:hypothetical protein N3K66_007151 [Trichothecium roseum]|uniref:Uncharacterized protein n=1 Tax=Trichothecium roseum TaxID=47278 RepID=A0ACC0UXC9_9HYPO|nr:hypothetical protein N3K66_007151 [Trichothecium roseum]